MAIKNYTTKVDVYTSIGEIQGALARHGATKIMIDYDNGKPQAIAFGIDTPVGPRGFRLPAAVDGTLRVFANQKIKADREQAEMTAWRNVRDWARRLLTARSGVSRGSPCAGRRRCARASSSLKTSKSSRRGGQCAKESR